jgi:plastocyanin
VDWLMKEFRDRVLIPTLVPLGALAIIVVVVLNISRLLIALEERSGPNTVVALAVIVSSAILFGFTYFSSRADEERSPASVSLMSLAGIVIVLAGFFGAESLHEEEKEAAAKAAELAEQNKPDLVVEAFDIGFKEKELKIGPGKVRIQEVNTGATAHTFVLEGVSSGRKLSVPGNGSKDTAAFDLQPGTYTYFCDIAGHRQAGMEGKLIVDPSAPAPGSGGAAGGGGGGGTPVKIDGADLSFAPKEVTAPPGPITISLNNIGKIHHTLVIDGVGNFKKLEADPGQTPSETWADAKPGSYVLYCDVPGHRAAGMEATLKVG